MHGCRIWDLMIRVTLRCSLFYCVAGEGGWIIERIIHPPKLSGWQPSSPNCCRLPVIVEAFSEIGDSSMLDQVDGVPVPIPPHQHAAWP